MSASYKVQTTAGETRDFHATVCYAPWYFDLDRVDEMVVRVPQGNCEWITGTFDTDVNKYDVKTQKRFIGAISRMVDIPVDVELVDYNGYDVIQVTMNDVSKRSEIAVLILLNSLRYLHEADMNAVVDEFTSLYNATPEADFLPSHEIWNLYADAHNIAEKAGVMGNINHNVYQHFMQLNRLTKGQYEEEIIRNFSSVHHGRRALLPAYATA